MICVTAGRCSYRPLRRCSEISVGATLAVARGRGRTPPLRTVPLGPMTLLRCPKFLRCLTADAGNFDRGHSLTSLLLPLAALSSLPTSARITALLASCHCEGAARPWQSVPLVPKAPLPKGGWHGEAVTGGFFPAPTAGHTGPALQGVALSGPGGQGRPPLQNPIGKRCVGADAYIGPPGLIPHFLLTVSLRSQCAH